VPGRVGGIPALETSISNPVLNRFSYSDVDRHFFDVTWWGETAE
jgi:hypothetical protein